MVEVATIARTRWRRAAAALLVAGVVLTVAGAAGPHILWNLTPSLPRGLYVIRPVAPPRRGAVVSLPPPRDAADLIVGRGYLPPGASLLKLLVALPGDSVCIDRRSFSANHRVLGTVANRDSAGRPLVAFEFCGEVPEGYGVVATAAPLSFDSRYFGPVPLSTLTVAEPVWTF